MELSTAMDAFLAARSHLSPNQQRLYAMWFTLWRRHGADGDVIDQAAAFLGYLRTDYRTRQGAALAASSQLSAWRCLRAFVRWLADAGQLGADGPAQFRRRVPAPRVEEAIRETYSPATFDALIAATADEPPALGARNRAMLWIARESGMRAQELVTLAHSRLDAARAAAQIRGKGGRWAWVCWGDAGAQALATWLAVRPRCTLDSIFVSVVKAPAPLTYEAWRSALRRLAARAGVDLPNGACIHALRHTFAHEMLDAGVESLHLQQMMRHKSMDMTARYVRERADKLRTVQQDALRRLRPDAPAGPGDS